MGHIKVSSWNLCFSLSKKSTLRYGTPCSLQNTIATAALLIFLRISSSFSRLFTTFTNFLKLSFNRNTHAMTSNFFYSNCLCITVYQVISFNIFWAWTTEYTMPRPCTIVSFEGRVCSIFALVCRLVFLLFFSCFSFFVKARFGFEPQSS